MKLLGITGGIGMGKSTAGGLLEKRGIAVVDTDAIARRLTGSGQPAVAEIAAAFGAGVMSGSELNRKELAGIVFANNAARAKLEVILHPRIRAAWQAEVEQWRAGGRACGAVIIPLLYETQAENLFDSVVCLACSAASQFERLRERGWPRPEIKHRLEAQWPVEEKMNRADFVVWTETTLQATAAQLDRVLLMAAGIPLPSEGITSSRASGAPV